MEHRYRAPGPDHWMPWCGAGAAGVRNKNDLAAVCDNGFHGTGQSGKREAESVWGLDGPGHLKGLAAVGCFQPQMGQAFAGSDISV